MCDCKERGLGSKIQKSGTWLCDHNRLSKVFPQIVELWSPNNKFGPGDVTSNTSKRNALLICENQNCKHVNDKNIGEIGRTKQFICSKCRFKHDFKVKANCQCETNNIGVRAKDKWICSHNSLAMACPNIKEYWRQSNALQPEAILAESHTKCKLRCKNNHEKDEIATRLRQVGKYECQQCDLMYNNAATRYPHLVNEVNDGTDLSRYLYGSQTIISWKCSVNDCGHVWNAMIQARTIDRHGCPRCAGNAPHTYETFLAKANRVHKNKYLYPSTCENFSLHSKISITCPIEFHGVFLQRGRGHAAGAGCPKCGQFSRGESIITQFLTVKSIKFTSQERFILLKEVKDRRFKYDFYLPDYNLVIEFDGVQHFKVTNWTTDRDKNSVLARMKKDVSKEQFLLNNGISLVRIPYTNIENIPTYLDWLLPKLDPKQHNILTYSHYIGQLVNTSGTFIAYTEVQSPPIDWSNIY